LCCRSLTTQKWVFRIWCPTRIQYSIYTQFRNSNYYQYSATLNFRQSYTIILRLYLPILLSLIKCKKRCTHKLPMIWCQRQNCFFLYLFYTICKWLLYSQISYFIWTYSSLHRSHNFSFCQCDKSNTLNNSYYYYQHIYHIYLLFA
jgi:hypothetical protein